MASYRGHLTVSALLGAGVTAVAWRLDLGWGPAILAGGLTALGGLLPDLDSDSSVPQRELFGLSAAAAAFLVLRPLEERGFTLEQRAVLAGGLYLLVRYGVRAVFDRFTVHRGMFHSIPALLIAGLIVFLLDHGPNLTARLMLAGGTMAGFLSHLVLDELYAIDLLGSKLRPNKYAGSALKFFSPSVPATIGTYLVLLALAVVAWQEVAALQARQASSNRNVPREPADPFARAGAPAVRPPAPLAPCENGRGRM
jgi:membrane-bound metal-dependent hydrolase YbcI (DUF457 family)